MLLLNILPYETAQEIKKNGSVEAKLFNQATVLFTDFRAFTKLAEVLSPTELVLEINEYFSAFDLIMEKYDVEKIKTIGDAYMAVGGIPTPSPKHASNVIKAALEIQAYIEEQKTLKLNAGKRYFEARIGVHTGPVIAGVVGLTKIQYDVWGDTVNTAAAMETAGTVGEVNISETTYALIKDQFSCIPRGMVQAKGKGTIAMYFVRHKNKSH